MKKIIRLMGIALIAMAFAACGKSASPEGAVDAFLKSYQKGDYKALIEQTHFRTDLTQEQKEQFAKVLEEKIGPELEKKGGIASYDIEDASISEDGHSATVAYTIHYGNGSEKKDSEKLLLVNGKWMIDSGK